MIITTTNTVECRTIRDYRGIVVGEAIMGANIFWDFFDQVTDIAGGRSGPYETKLQDARDTAMRDLEERGQGCGRERRGGCRPRLRGGGEFHADGFGERDGGGSRLA